MTINGWIQILVYFALLTALTRPMGGYLYRVFNGERILLGRALGGLERVFYRCAGVEAHTEQSWIGYTLAMLAFNLVCFVTLFLLLLVQGHLPFNPQGFGALTPDLAFNTAISFVTNTNWQSYGGETTLSYGTQMLASPYTTSYRLRPALAWHSHWSAALHVARPRRWATSGST